jgi:Reverse transcriptase (RNA-dependent DNA polymerase)
VYPLGPGEQEALQKFLKEHLDKGYVRPSKSPYTSPFFFIKKKDGKLHLVQDYRKLNALTIRNRYPLPLIPELIDHIRGHSLFTKLDIRWGYNNIRIRNGDQWKAAFKTNQGLFEPMVMFFGLTNSPATFQTMMNHIFRDLIDEGYVTVYMDDILIHTPNDPNLHRNIVHRVLKALGERDLYLKLEKCQFEATTIEYLGVVVEGNQL